jgi:hypothetical protein
MRRAVTLICLLLSFFAFSTEISRDGYFVTTKKLNVRAAPNANAEIVSKRNYRQRVYIEELKGEWARIARYDDKTLPDGTKSSSWVLLKHLSTEQPELPKSKYESNAISEQIVRSYPDRGRYFLLYVENAGGNYITIHSRIGVDATGYTKSEIDCRSLTYRELGYTERHIEYFNHAEDKPGDWVNLVSGSSKSDLVQYVCGTRGRRNE